MLVVAVHGIAGVTRYVGSGAPVPLRAGQVAGLETEWRPVRTCCVAATGIGRGRSWLERWPESAFTRMDQKCVIQMRYIFFWRIGQVYESK